MHKIWFDGIGYPGSEAMPPEVRGQYEKTLGRQETMSQKDFILRQIEMLGAALVAIRKMILGGSGGAEEIESRLQSVSQTGGMALDLARAASPDTIHMLIAPTGEIEPGSCWLLAETLYLDGLYATQVGDSDRAMDSLGKARMLFSLLKPMGAFLVGFPEASERIKEIDGLVEG